MNGQKELALAAGIVLFGLAIAFVVFRLILIRARQKNRYRSSRQRQRHQHWSIRFADLVDRFDRKLTRAMPKSRRRRRSRRRAERQRSERRS